jgi:hypothetical protein
MFVRWKHCSRMRKRSPLNVTEEGVSGHSRDAVWPEDCTGYGLSGYRLSVPLHGILNSWYLTGPTHGFLPEKHHWLEEVPQTSMRLTPHRVSSGPYPVGSHRHIERQTRRRFSMRAGRLCGPNTPSSTTGGKCVSPQGPLPTKAITIHDPWCFLGLIIVFWSKIMSVCSSTHEWISRSSRPYKGKQNLEGAVLLTICPRLHSRHRTSKSASR